MLLNTSTYIKSIANNDEMNKIFASYEYWSLLRGRVIHFCGYFVSHDFNWLWVKQNNNYFPAEVRGCCIISLVVPDFTAPTALGFRLQITSYIKEVIKFPEIIILLLLERKKKEHCFGVSLLAFWQDHLDRRPQLTESKLCKGFVLGSHMHNFQERILGQ